MENFDPNSKERPREPESPNSSSADDFQSAHTSQNKSYEKMRNAYDHKNVDELYRYAKYNKIQILTYCLLVFGLITLLLNNILGGLIIGAVAGYYFSPEIIYYLRNFRLIIKGQEHIRYITLTGLLLGFLIAAPGIFIGAAIVAAFKQVLFNDHVEF